jgi:hypothetical protein
MNTNPSNTPAPAKAGLLQRFCDWLDRLLKNKAEAKAKEGSCCGGPGGKCC